MGLTYILSMWEVVHEFIKFVQSHDVFICDFVRVMNMCCVVLYSIYYDPKKSTLIYNLKVHLILWIAQMMGS
jgi:hypothetical protein